MSLPIDTPLIINVAPTGAVADAGKNAKVPIVEDRIVDDVEACARLGAGIAHVHVRDEEGRPSCDAWRYASLIERLRAGPAKGLVLCASLSGRHGQTPEQRAAVLDVEDAARPDMGSLTLSSMNFAGGPSINSPDTIRFLARRMLDRGVKAELEVFDVGMVHFARALIAEGLIEAPYYFNILLGNVAGVQCSANDVAAVVNLLPADSLWSLAGIGRQQRPSVALGCVLASGVRTGLEDNLWYFGPAERERRPASNPELVADVAQIAKACNRRLADPQTVRAMLGLATVTRRERLTARCTASCHHHAPQRSYS